MMKRYLSLVGAVIAAAVCLGFAAAGGGDEAAPKSQIVELAGRLQRPVKWDPQLELIPGGQIRRIDLHGKLLEGVKEGTFLRVRGVVRSRLHRGGTAQNPSPFPAQWVIWLEVAELEVLDNPDQILKEVAG
jgi:hypothetical protein